MRFYCEHESYKFYTGRFVNHILETEDEELINRLKAHKNYGTYFYEMVPVEKPKVDPRRPLVPDPELQEWKMKPKIGRPRKVRR